MKLCDPVVFTRAARPGGAVPAASADADTHAIRLVSNAYTPMYTAYREVGL
jgi:hypothetical protein